MAGYFKLWLIVILIFQVLISTAGGVGAAYYFCYNRKKICPGIEVSGISLDGLELSAAKEKLERELPRLTAITLKWDQKKFVIPLHSDVYAYSIDEAVEKAFSLADPFVGGWDKALNAVRWRPARQSVEAPVAVSSSYLLRELKALREYIDREPEDAALIIENGAPFYREEKEGTKLNVLETKAFIEEHLRQGKLEQIPLRVDTVSPRITKEHLPNFSQCLALYKTPLDVENFSNRNSNRNHNIELAVIALNGWIIEPGQTFSFNEVVGPATKEKGFLEAPVLRNKQLVLDVGGGICQVATTLYQAALRAELEIVQRSRHSRPVSYVPLGQDATVAYDLLDLKIRNNRDFPVILTGKVDDASITMSIWGAEKEANKIVEIVTEDVKVIPPSILEHPDPNLAKDLRRQVQKGEEGYKVKVYRLIYEGGVEKSRELISTDLYPPVNEIVHIGTKEVVQIKK